MKVTFGEKEKTKESKRKVKVKALLGAKKRCNKEAPDEHPPLGALSETARSTSVPLFFLQ